MVAEPPTRARFGVMPGAQWDFVHSTARHPAMISGVQGGKTVASVVKAGIYCLNHPGAMGCLTAPTYTNVEDVLLRTFYKVWGEGVGKDWEFLQRRMTIRYMNGSLILLRPSEEPDKLRGLVLAFFGMDEASPASHHESFMVLQERLTQKGHQHQGWLTTTPKGLNSWVYHRWVKHQTPQGEPLPVDEYVIYRARTRENFHLTKEYVKSLETSFGGPNSKWARQELEGEFVAFEGQAFPQFDERIHVQDPPVGTKFRRSVIGMDWGAVNPTALLLLQQDMNGRVWVTREFYRRRCDLRELLTEIAEWPPASVVCDPTAKDAIEFLQRNGVKAKKARSNDFKLRAQLVAGRLGIGPDGLPGMYISPSCPNLIAEIPGLMYARHRGDMEYYDRWEQGCDDHAFDADAYGLMEMDAGARGRPQPGVIWTRWGHRG